jgi:hypothetical protein
VGNGGYGGGKSGGGMSGGFGGGVGGGIGGNFFNQRQPWFYHLPSCAHFLCLR